MQEYIDIGMQSLNAGSSVEQLYFDLRLNFIVCVAAKKGFENVECFFRHVDAEVYTKIEVPLIIWKITVVDSVLIAVDNLNGFPTQKAFALCLSSGKQSLGEVKALNRPDNGKRAWVSRFLPATCGSKDAICVYAQELVTMASGGGIVEYSVGQLSTESFEIRKLARLVTPYV